MAPVSERHTSVVVLGGGPGGYEAALVAAQLGAAVTVVDRDGLGGAAVLTDCVPEQDAHRHRRLHDRRDRRRPRACTSRAPRPTRTVPSRPRARSTRRVLGLAAAQSDDIATRLEADGRAGPAAAWAGWSTARTGARPRCADGEAEELDADVVLSRHRRDAAGPGRRASPTASASSTWQQIYDLHELPEQLVVVGSGVTGAEFAHAYLGARLARSRWSPRATGCCPARTPTRPTVHRGRLPPRGMAGARAAPGRPSVERTGDGVAGARSTDGREVERLARPDGRRLRAAAPRARPGGGRRRARRRAATSRSTGSRAPRCRGIYAAGDCTGVLPLASVAAMQGRIAMWHALGDAVAPLNLRTCRANVFTDPEIATVGVSQKRRRRRPGSRPASVMLPLATNAARQDAAACSDGFVKLFARNGSDIVVGGVVVAPRASELIFPVALAVQHRLTVDQLAQHLHGLPVAVRLDRRGRPAAALPGLKARRASASRARAVQTVGGGPSRPARSRRPGSKMAADAVPADRARAACRAPEPVPDPMPTAGPAATGADATGARSPQAHRSPCRRCRPGRAGRRGRTPRRCPSRGRAFGGPGPDVREPGAAAIA